MLWRIWHVLTVLAAQHGNPRHRFDPATLRSLKPRTVRSYQIQVGRLVQWLDSEGRKPEDEYDWDDNAVRDTGAAGGLGPAEMGVCVRWTV